MVAAHSDNAIYTGLALLQTPSGPFLLAADFRHARIDVFDATWQPVNLGSAFTDPGLPAGYAPFNVQVLGGAVYVAYALQGEGGEEEVAGHTLGFVDKYTDFGQTAQRIASRGNLNAPWGLAIAPGSFGKYAGALLVGNFGDGRIGAYTNAGKYLGFLRDRDNDVIAIDGLWALLPGTATSGGTDAVWFSAGPDEETHGLVGVLRPASQPPARAIAPRRQPRRYKQARTSTGWCRYLGALLHRLTLDQRAGSRCERTRPRTGD